MEYFIIERYRYCIKELDNYDACGISPHFFPYGHSKSILGTQCHRNKLWTHHGPILYFSGNFWWANSVYLCKLPKIESLYWGSRFNAEFWINNGMGNLKTFFDCCDEIDMFDFESIRRKYPVNL
jgi:hypothetical protein